jgi:hypothetical protein
VSRKRPDANVIHGSSNCREKQDWRVKTQDVYRHTTPYQYLNLIVLPVPGFLNSWNSSIYLSLSLSLWLYSPFVGHWPLFQFLNPIHSRQHSMDGGSARRKAAAYTQNNTNRIDAHRHQCLEWDSNPRSQRSSDRRQFMSETARPLWSGFGFIDRRNPTGHKIWIFKKMPQKTKIQPVSTPYWTQHSYRVFARETCRMPSRRLGFYRFNGDAIPREAVAPSQLTNKNTPHNNKIIKILLGVQ